MTRLRWLAALLGAASGCGEGAATPAKDPASEASVAVAAPRVDRPDVAAAVESSVAAAPLASAAPSAPVDPAAAVAAAAPTGHLEGAGRLSRLFEALASVDAGHAVDDVRILQYGDSHTASDLGTSTFRRLLQARFGDGGRGFVALGKPWKFYSQDGVRGGMTSGFEPAKTRYKAGQFSGDGCYGLLGIGVGAHDGAARAWTEVAAKSTRFELDYWQEPHGGSFDVVVDGAVARRVTSRAPQAASGFVSLDVADAPHQIEVRTVGDGDVRVFGVALDRPEAGVVVDALGINGAQIFTPMRWSEEHFAEQLRHRAPALVVLAYGTNEALEPGLSDAEYERKLVDLLGRIARAAPAASCLLLGPPDLARHTKGLDDWKPWPRVLEIVAAQRRVAQAAGCAFYDQLEAMGGPGSIMAWASEASPRAGRDWVHLTRAGYMQVATSFATDLVRGYDAWRAEHGLPPTSASKTWGVALR